MNKISAKRNTQSVFISIVNKIIPAFAPLIFGIYPALYYYANNSSIVLISSFIRLFGIYVAIIFFVYGLYLILNRFSPFKAANAACVFMLFFNTYGIIYESLLKIDIIRIEHYTLLPLLLLLSIYLSWLITKPSKRISKSIFQFLLVIFSALSLISIVKIIPNEINKLNNQKTLNSENDNVESITDQNLPDIYFLVFDEFSGFEPMREYWHNNEVVDSFKAFLESNGFFVAENSHGSSIDTLRETATRLNFQEYPLDATTDNFFTHIANNQVMSYVKTKGYTTVVFEELTYAYATALPITADISYTVDNIGTTNTGALFDEFGMLVADKTVLYAFADLYKISNPQYIKHQQMVLFTTAKLSQLQEIQSPKFIYSHILLPHFPFMWDSNGGFNAPENYQNWNYYEGNYNHAVKTITKLIKDILAVSDPQNPPIIILQSDHGARNKDTKSPGSAILPDFPEDFKTNILYTLNIPGFDTSQLTQDINPINTFPIIFNYLFDENIPLK